MARPMWTRRPRSTSCSAACSYPALPVPPSCLLACLPPCLLASLSASLPARLPACLLCVLPSSSGSYQVCLHTVAMVQCTLIMGSILKNGKAYVDEEAEEHFMFRCLLFVRSFSLGDRPPAPRRTFEAFWEYRCEDDWRKAFSYFTWGTYVRLCFSSHSSRKVANSHRSNTTPFSYVS
ncbi:unnamed protein product [Closterium sp. NIES-54]